MVGSSRASRALGLVTAFVLAAQVVALAWLGARAPEPPTFAPDLPLAARLERLDRELLARLPPFSETFAWWPLRYVPELRQALTTTRDPEVHARLLAELEQTIPQIRQRYLATVTLLAWALLAGALALLSTALRGPSLPSLFAPLGAALAVTPVITEPVLGNDYGATLLPFVAPMLIGGALVLLLERAALAAPLQRTGGLLAARPTLLALLTAALLGALGAACIRLGLDERLDVVTELGAVFVGMAILHLLVAVLFTASRLTRRSRP